MIREEFPAVVYVKNERNMGFAFSANKGASLAEDEYILFLNSDTILMQGELEKMVRFMDSNADVAICGPQLVYPDMKPQRSFAAVPSLSAEFFLRGKRRDSADGALRFHIGIDKLRAAYCHIGVTIHETDHLFEFPSQ